jgi:carboxylesterase type B
MLRDSAQQAVSDSLTGYWAQFLAKGSPGKGGGPAWPKFAASKDKRLVFGLDSTTIDSGDFEATHHCDFWLEPQN